MDRRKTRRAVVNQRCWFDTDDLTLYIRILNASVGGLFLKTAIPLPVGTRATLTWESKDRRKIVANVEVMWLRQPASTGQTAPGMGIRFLNFVEGGEAFVVSLKEIESLSNEISHMS